MKIQGHKIFLFVILAALIFIAGCTAAQDESSAVSGDSADDLYSKAQAELADSNYGTAFDLFGQAFEIYKESGDNEKAIDAKNGMFLAEIAVMEFPFNRTQAVENMKEKITGITDEEINDWLDNSAQKIESDGETLYFAEISSDYLYENFELLQEMDTLDFDYVGRYAFGGESASADATESNPYVNPIRYTGTETLSLPADIIPPDGTLKVWFPLPVETDSQTEITVENLSYSEYIVSGPVTTGKIGYVYYEIPVEEINGNLLITANIEFTSYEQIFKVDPDKVEAYNTSDREYITYTVSERNIGISDDITAKAKEIVGDETNPYLQAQLIYDYIITTYPYSHAPHGHLDLVEPKIAESTYMFETGHGDCGTQSMLFSALCRAVGIPARALGGYQMLLAESPGTHFWAEYYIEGYGWIPCDTTVAEVADWVDISDEDREEFKEYYSSNLDPARYIIQKNVDAGMSPEIPDDAVLFHMVRQSPAIISDSPDQKFELVAGSYFKVDLREQK